MARTIAHQAASKQLSDSRETVTRLSLAMFVLTLLVIIPDAAHAGAGSDPLSTTICLVVGWFTGGMGRAIATLGIVVLGIGAMMGKVSWQMALIVAFGLSVMFSGARIVTLLTSEDASFCVGDLAFSSGYIEAVLCRVAELATRPTGLALCTLCIIFLGVGALMGKVSAGLAILLSVGIAVTTQASVIAERLITGLGGAWVACSPVVA